MKTFTATPYQCTRALSMSDDEYNMLAAALQFTLNHIMYDTKNDTYYWHEHLPWKKVVTLHPEEFEVLEQVAFRVIGEVTNTDVEEDERGDDNEQPV